MQQLNEITVRGPVIKASIETRDNGRSVLSLTVMTKYVYGYGSKTVEETEFHPCIVYESKDNNKALLLSVKKDSLVTVKGRLKRFNGQTEKTIVCQKLSIHKIDTLSAQTDIK